MSARCVIVGGGISGLSAAYELHRQGIPFVLLEGASRFGGVIRTERADGFVVDAAADALLAHKPAALTLCRELGVETVPARSTRAFIARRGRLCALPDGAMFGIPTDCTSFARSRAFSMVGKLRMAAEYFVPRRPADANRDESIASFIGRRFGREALERLGEPLMAGIHSGSAHRLSMRALFPRFVEFERIDGSVLRGLRRYRRGARTAAGPSLMCVRGGTERLIDALISSLPPSSVISNAPVRGLERCSGWRAHLANGGHVDAGAILLATPPQSIADLVNELQPSLSKPLRRITSVPLVTVALGYRREDVRHPLSGSGFVVPSQEGAGVNAVTWMSSKWYGRTAADRVLLRALLGGSRDPSAASLSDADVVRRTRNDLRRYLDISSEPVFERVYRMPHAGVQLEVGHLDVVSKVQAQLDAMPGLFISAAGVRGVGLADCVGDARAQAAAAADYLRR